MNDVSYATLDDVLEIHEMVVEATGGSSGVRDQALVEAAVHRPRQTFGGDELYTTLCCGRRPRISRA